MPMRKYIHEICLWKHQRTGGQFWQLLDVCNVNEMIQECNIHWCQHIQCMEASDITKRVMNYKSKGILDV